MGDKAMEKYRLVDGQPAHVSHLESMRLEKQYRNTVINKQMMMLATTSRKVNRKH